MTRRYGIDTSILVRLLTRDPEGEFVRCVEALRVLIEDQGDEVFASNQVIGEAYVVIQHHYGVSKDDARIIFAQHTAERPCGPSKRPDPSLKPWMTTGGPGIFDRLIADGYSRVGLDTLTLDRQDGIPGRRE